MPGELQTRYPRPRLDLQRTNAHPNAKLYEDSLRSTIYHYKIPKKVFTQSQEKVIAGTVRILSTYDMDESFCDDPEKNLFALAVGDQFFRSARTTTSLKKALSILKVVAVDEQEKKTLSGYVESLAGKDKKRGTLFTPRHIQSGEGLGYYERIAAYIDTNEDRYLSGELSYAMSKWGAGSLLHDCRTDLKITPDTENFFYAATLKKTSDEIADDLGFVAYTSDHREVATIAVGRDWTKRPHYVVHEYLHGQEGVDFARGLKRLVLDGAREGFISLYEGENTSYYWLREGIRALFKYSNDLKEPFGAAFRGDIESRRFLFSEITKRHGFEGLLTLAFMWDMKQEQEAYDETTNAIRKAAHIYAGHAYGILESPGYIWRW